MSQCQSRSMVCRRTVVSLLAIACILAGCRAQADTGLGPKVREIRPLVLDLNPKPGVNERYTGLQAHVEADPASEQGALLVFAQKLFDETLRPSLAKDANMNLAFVTFYLGPAAVNGQQLTKTFRVVYQRKNGEWMKLK